MSIDIHTCHAECPCHSGGKPPADFPDASSLAELELDGWLNLLEDVAARAERADAIVEEARITRDQIIHGAINAGATYAEAARRSGLTRGRVHQIAANRSER